MKIKDLLNKDAVEVFSESSLDAIQEAFDSKVDIATESALIAQDELYAKKLDTLIKTIDKDHTAKMKKIVEAVDQDRAQKLLKVVKKYERTLNEDATQYKQQLVGAVSVYLDEFLEESVSTEDLATAVKNKSAMSVLGKLRNVLSVGSVMMNESIQEAVLDGKSQITSLQEENTELKNKMKQLSESYNNVRVNSLIEEKISSMDDDKKSFIRKTLKDKSFEFIKENFDYVSRLFDKKEKEKIKNITEDAKKKSANVDFIPKTEKILTENLNTNEPSGGDIYLSELSKVFGTR
jgi:3-methyladenine DNA glycosylase AlkC